MNIIKLFTAGLITFLSGNLFSQENDNSLLWKISGNGLTQPSYLYGTIHIIDKKDFHIRKEIDSVFALSEQAAFEFKLDDLGALLKAQSWMKLPEGQSLQTLCTPEQYAKIKSYFRDSLQIDITPYDNQKPFALYQQLTTSYVEGEMESFELYFLQKSMASSKTIKGLETIEDQLVIFDSIPYSEQIDWLITGIDSAASYRVMWDEMIATYNSEDLDALWAVMMENSPEIMEYESDFLTDRNKRWIPVIETMMKEKSTFIAVGAAHLMKQNGVIHLLRKAGYEVTPL